MTSYNEAMAALNERKAANRKALSEAQSRRDSAMNFGKKAGFVSTKVLGNRGLHAKIKEVIGGMIRK